MEAKKQNKLDRVYRRYNARVNSLLKTDKDARTFLSLLESSQETELTQVSRLELKKFDLKWIEDLEKGLDAIERIVNNPKRFIKDVGNIVPIELAKKINGQSVIHLSQHTQFVQKVNNDGTVIPSKIMTVYNEDDFAIYENRFVKTLIERLILFMEKRYEYIERYSDTKDSDVLMMKAKTIVNGAIIEYETKIKISVPSYDGGNAEANRQLLEKIKMMRDKIRFYATCPFMALLKGSKPVPTPIVQTNILMKNPDYRRCYKLWQFIDTYDKIGFDIDVKETNAQFNKEYIEELYQMMMTSTMTMASNKREQIDFASRGTRKYRLKPRIRKFYVDEFVSEMEFEQIEKVLHSDGILHVSKEQYEAALKKEKQDKEKEAKRLALERVKERERLRKERLKELEEKRRQEAVAKRKAKMALEKARRLARQQALKAEIARKKAEEAERRRYEKMLDDERKRLQKARGDVVVLATDGKQLPSPKLPITIVREEIVEEEIPTSNPLEEAEYIEIDEDQIDWNQYEVEGEIPVVDIYYNDVKKN